MSAYQKNTFQRLSIVAHLLCFVIWTSLFMAGMMKGAEWIKDLDERELVITNNAIRFAYTVLAIASPLVLYIFFFAKLKLNIVLPFAFLYLAHILPAVYLGWLGEKR